MNALRYSILFAACLVPVASASAQGKDPLDVKASVRPVQYLSVFDGYKNYRDTESVSWKQANHEVMQSGGHSGHASHQSNSSPNDAAAQPMHQHHHHGAHKK